MSRYLKLHQIVFMLTYLKSLNMTISARPDKHPQKKKQKTKKLDVVDEDVEVP